MNMFGDRQIGKYGIDGFWLKIIAGLSMLIDHTGAIFFPDIILFRVIGRLAFPIFAFLVVEGFWHTRDVRRYLLRLLLFGIISELPFDFAFYGKIELQHQNVLFMFFIAVLFMTIDRQYGRKAGVAAFFVLGITAELLRTDYGLYGIVIVALFYFSYQSKWQKFLFTFLALTLMAPGVQSFSALGLIPLYFYNQQRGRKIKYFFYIYYPAHLFLLFIIYKIIHPML